MATSKSLFSRPNYRFLPGERERLQIATSDSAFELDESDIYNSVLSNSSEFQKSLLISTRLSKKTSAKRAGDNGNQANGCRQSSFPVNIPDWSKILRDEYKEHQRDSLVDDDGDDIEDDCEEVRVPPHELLARSRIASFSVHEGIGRTLKGRDLSRVRNSIWEKTGFED